MSLVGSIREAVRQIDASLPLTNVSTQMEEIERRFMQEKLFAQAYALFGGIALLLAAIGLFGLMSYSVARRTNEIGIRMALGAERLHVLRMVMGESMALVVIGIVLGVVVALAAGRFVAALLFGVAATDTLTMIAAVLVMLVVSAFAGYLPARRASAVDPMVALHED
jgi:ABC-type antimicrobial peptide transport system permease subunit